MDDGSGALPPFVFVPVAEDEAARGRGVAKRVIRAHVARVQHAKSSAVRSLQPSTFKPYIPRPIPAPPETTRRKSSRSAGHAHGASEKSDASSDDASALIKPGEIEHRSSSSSGGTSPFSHDSSWAESRSTTPLPRLTSGTHQEDPFWTLPVEYNVFLPPIFAHYVQNIAVEIPDLDGSSKQGLIRRRWLPLAMTEPATMYAVLVMAASHFRTLDPAQIDRIDILHLKARALSEIKTAFADPSRALTDAVIGAVMKMAAYEAVFGDPSVYAEHMRGLGLMVRLRGGLSELGLDGFLERMLVWIDLNAAHLTGSSRTLGGRDLPTTVEFESPDPHHFAGIS